MSEKWAGSVVELALSVSGVSSGKRFVAEIGLKVRRKEPIAPALVGARSEWGASSGWRWGHGSKSAERRWDIVVVSSRCFSRCTFRCVSGHNRWATHGPC